MMGHFVFYQLYLKANTIILHTFKVLLFQNAFDLKLITACFNFPFHSEFSTSRMQFTLTAYFTSYLQLVATALASAGLGHA